MPENATDIFTREMLRNQPSLKAFAISLCGNVSYAEDLVQETYLRALANSTSFEPGTNMSAWLFTILRNLFRSEYRKKWREVEDADGSYAETLKSRPSQEGKIEFDEFRKALERLPPEQKEALVLVGATGFSYQEAAEVAGCAVGTIKSRVARARERLSRMLAVEPSSIGGGDEIHDAAEPRYSKPQHPASPQPVFRPAYIASRRIEVRPARFVQLSSSSIPKPVMPVPTTMSLPARRRGELVLASIEFTRVFSSRSGRRISTVYRVV